MADLAFHLRSCGMSLRCQRPTVLSLLIVGLLLSMSVRLTHAQVPQPLIPTGHQGGMGVLAVSEDSRFFVSGDGQGHLKVWDLTNGSLAAETYTPGRFTAITSAAVRPGTSSVLFATRGGRMYTWDWDRDEQVPLRIDGWDNITLSLVFSSDGRWLAMGSDYGEVAVWDLQKQSLAWMSDVASDALEDESAIDRKVRGWVHGVGGRQTYAPYIDEMANALKRPDIDVEHAQKRITARSQRERDGFWKATLRSDTFTKLFASRMIDVAFRDGGAAGSDLPPPVAALGQAGHVFVLSPSGAVDAQDHFVNEALTAALSPNGAFAVVASTNGKVEVWDVDARQLSWTRLVAPSPTLVSLSGQSWIADPRDLQVSADGRHVAVCARENALVVRSLIDTGAPEATVSFGSTAAADCQISFVDGSERVLVAHSDDRANYQFSAYRVSDNVRLQSIRTVQSVPVSIDVISDKQIVLHSKTNHAIWDLGRGRLTAMAQRTHQQPGRASFSPRTNELFYATNDAAMTMQVDGLRLPRATQYGTGTLTARQPVPRLRCPIGAADAGRQSHFMVVACRGDEDDDEGTPVFTHAIAFRPGTNTRGPLVELPAATDTTTGPMQQLAVHPQNAEAATGSNLGQIIFWNLSEGAAIDTVSLFKVNTLGLLSQELEGRISAMTYTGNGRGLIAAGYRTGETFGDIVGATPDRLKMGYYRWRKSGFKRDLLGPYARLAEFNFSEENLGDIQAVAADDKEQIAAAGTTSGHLLLVNLGDESTLHRIDTHGGPVLDVAFLPGGSQVAALSASGAVSIWDVQKGTKVATLLSFETSTPGSSISATEWMVLTPEGYYAASKGAARLVGFRHEGNVFAFSQFDVRFNRPDLVLKALGRSDESTVQSYANAYAKRLEKMGFEAAMLEGDLDIPTVDILEMDAVDRVTLEPHVSLTLLATDASHALDRVRVWVNDVPLNGKNGIPIQDDASQEHQMTITVPLTHGDNVIDVASVNRRGIESLQRSVSVRSDAPQETPDLHVIAIGVSQYQDETHNLEYAAKDAIDIATLLQSQSQRYGAIHTHMLTDADATVSNILEMKTTLQQTAIEDHVVVFAAGHGLVDPNREYYFATHETDFDNPAATGLPFDQLEGILDGIPARRKVLFLDACHAGEIDEDEIAGLSHRPAEEGKPSFRGSGQIRAASGTSAFNDMHEIFVDLRRRTGATVIASSGGAQRAYEGEEWENGVFTYVLRNGLASGEADTDKNGRIMVSEIEDYVRDRVERLTNGDQRPIARTLNQTSDFQIW